MTTHNGQPLPKKHVAHFLDTVAWAGGTLEDTGARLVVHGDRGGLLQAEVDKREVRIRAWWKHCEGVTE